MWIRSAFLALALLVFGTPVSAQQDDPSTHVPAGDCWLPIKGGSGSTFWRVCLSPTGNLTRLESPLGVEHLNIGQAVEGWALCREDGWDNAWDFDAGREEDPGGNIDSSSFRQPNGPGTLPFAVYTAVFPGLQVQQHYTRNSTEREITVKMVVKNVGTATVTGITLHRMLDADVDGTWSDDIWATSKDSVAVIDGGTPGRGISLTAGTWNVSHWAAAGVYGGFNDLSKGGEVACYMPVAGPRGAVATTGAGDFVALASYTIGSLRPGYSKTVTFTYRVF